MATDNKQLLLFGHCLPGNEISLLERIKDCGEKRNKGICAPLTSTLNQLPAEQIAQISIGSNHIAFLLKDFRIARLQYEIIKNTIEPIIPIDTKGETGPSGSNNTAATGGTSGGPASSSDAATAAAANRTAKIRRIMMARPGARSGGFCRTGVIIDRNRSRPVVPASAVSEDLIVQCQVVLQGKSREVIVRELQRTNLNVNEAVNNLLSRDDDEIDDMYHQHMTPISRQFAGDNIDESSEAYLHEELLSLLDAGLRDTGSAAAAALLDNESIYSTGDGYEYLISRDLARRRGEEGKSKDAAKESDPVQMIQEQIVLGDKLIYWGGQTDNETDTHFQYPAKVEKFIKIASMHSEMLALADNGEIYTWSWEKDTKPSKHAHPAINKFYNDGNKEHIIEMESCGLRTVVLTNSRKMASFMDSSCGRKLSEAFSETLVEVPEEVTQLFCTTLYSAVLTKSGKIFWRGIYPFNERRKLWEKARSKKKQVTFETGTEIVVGSEVRTKSTPIFSVGSVAVNFNEGVPMIGILNEDAWTLNETCRFRMQTPQAYDNTELEKPNNQKEKRVWFNLAGNRKRNASAGEHQESETGTAVAKSANTNPTYVLRAWNLKDVIFIHEECINDTSIVKIVDGAYCGVLFKSTLDKLEAESGGTSSSTAATELMKGIRLMRKDDLVLVSSYSRGARSPENFQTQLKQLRLPSSVDKIISLAVDSTGFRILCEEHSQLHLLRVGCLGKLFSNHLLPINLNSLCQNETSDESNLPSVNNFGEEGFLLLRDGSGNFQPLIRNALGGFKEMSYIGLGRIYRFGLGIQYYNSLNKINAYNTTICTEQFTVDKKVKSGVTYKDSNRLLLMAALIAPNPESIQPAIDSLMQAILFCNLKMVQVILQKLDGEINIEKRKTLIYERIDGNRNIFHIAALNSSAKTNKDQADLEARETPQVESQKMDNSEAEATKVRYDRKWQEMLGSTPTTRSKSQAVKEAIGKEEAEDKKESSSSSMGSLNNKGKEKGGGGSDEQDEFAKKISIQPKERQANSIAIVRELCKSSAISDFYFDLMRQQDVNGLTPFETAIHNRAYSAALTLWESTQEKKDWNQDTVDILLSTTTDESNDDSALFILCANDTCSYTWTGEEHAPQDIYECKTCGLVGTLCCCSECAYLCHRKHDCKLKRTSPVAYCDCWEKSDCKTLVVGNNAKRELLLQLMLHNTKLVERMNSKREHLLMFLARTVGRQLIEQESFVKRSKRPGPTQTTTASGIRIPEHDLDPPKFAKKALNLALANWDVVRSIMEIGMKKQTTSDAPILENSYYLGEHNGSTHLDKFVFTLLAWCEESSLDVLLNLFVRMANKQKQNNSDVHIVIQRFVRSVIRLFILVLLLSPNAVGTLLATISGNMIKTLPSNDDGQSTGGTAGMALSSSIQHQTPQGGTLGGSMRDSLQNYRAVAMSGMISLVRASLPAALGFGPPGTDKKDVKKNKIIAFITKCRRVFQTLLTYSINELIGAADAMIAPVRYGIVKPTGTISPTDDVLDLIQQHLNNEQDFSTLIKEAMGNNSAGTNQFAANSGAGQMKKMADMRRGEPGLGNEERGSDEENSNDEDEDEEEADGVQSTTAFSRTRENSNASTTAPPRVRTVPDQSRRRRDTNNTLEVDMDENMEEDQNEENMDDDEDESEHGPEDEIDEDDEEEDNAYFDIHDDDDEEDVEDSDNSDDDENPPEGEGDSNDTAIIGGAQVESANSEVRVELSSGDDTSMADPELRRIDAEVNIAQGNATGSSRNIPTNNNNDNTVSGSTSTSITAAEGNNNANNSRGIFRENSERARESRSTVLRTSASNTTPATIESSEPPRPSVQAPTAASTAATGGTTATPTVLPIEEDGYSPNNTSTQLAISFSVIVKLIDELLLQLMFHEKWKQQMARSKGGITAQLELDPNLYNVFKAILEEYYEPTWNWFQTIMDKTEAQLKYGNAINNVPISSFFNLSSMGQEHAENRQDEQGGILTRTRRTEVQRKYKRRLDAGTNKRTESWGDAAGGDSDQDITVRSEFFGYFLSLLRSASAENGDDFPQLEYNALKNVAFVCEAYLFHINYMDLSKQAEIETNLSKDWTGFDAKESLMEVDRWQDAGKKLRRFYQRSNSISYPLLSTAEKHHAFTFTAADALPLSAKTHLLNADAERDTLFALPTPVRSRLAHKEIASDHGIKFPTHQSLSNPPLKYVELIERLNAGPKTPPRNTRQISVQHYTRKTSKESIEEADSVDFILNNQFGLTASAIQRALGRWSKAITLFTRTFHDDLINSFGGDSIHSVLLNKTGVCSFNLRHAQFRKQMEKLKNTQAKDLAFTQMPREKYSILQQTFRQLNQHYVRRLSGTSTTTTPTQQQQQLANAIASATAGNGGISPPLASHKVKVTFRDEPGEGTGVARHFYAAVAEALSTIKHLPSPDNVNEDGTSKPLDPRGVPGKSASTGAASALAAAGKVGSKNNATSASSSSTSTARISTSHRGASAEGSLSTSSATLLTTDNQPLFYRAAKTTGFLAPITGSCTPQRLNAFRNVGRLIGICLQQTEIFPLPLCRHVFKFILDRHITWFDLAFFDPSLFDSLRSIVYNEEKDEYHPQDFYEALEMTFSVDLPPEEGGGTLELKPGGAEIPVTKENVLEYIYVFVEHRLLGPHIPCLEAISRGVFDVIPADSLMNLTSEDLRLILCGTQEVNIQLLQNFTKLLDESSASQEVLTKYKKTFWSVVNKFTNAEKQDLCFFWTGSPNLPSTEEGFQPLPTIMIRPADDAHLPTANTCISRLYIPLYSSKKILASKLQMAIKVRNFGFV